MGISKLRWDTAGSDWSNQDALKYMQDKQYDILPVAEGDHVRRYFATTIWNDYSAVESKSITHHDTVRFDTPIQDVIKRFGSENRNFVFLSSEHEIVGLVSVVNLNCRQVRTYIYTLLSELESSFADLLKRDIGEADFRSYIFREPLDRKRDSVRRQYEKDVDNGVDVQFLEYIYLSDMIDAIVHFGLCELLGFTKDDFAARLGEVCKLRNRVAHSTKSLVSPSSPPLRLWHDLDTIEEVLFQIKHSDKQNVKNPVGVSLD